MDTQCFRRLARKPLVACLATALVLGAGSASATASRHVAPLEAAILDRVNNGDPPPLPDWWKQPDPAEIAQRWHPAPHPSPEVPAGSIVVQNCNDSGAGSLRQALNDAVSGQTIDLTQLSCSSITLTTGSLLFTQTSITLQGPGSKYLEINGGDTYAPLLHNGLGTLYIDGLSIEHGAKYFTSAQLDDARGGCIFSGGEVYVTNSVIAYCQTKETDPTHRPLGGAIYAYTGVTLSNSSVIDSSAIGAHGAGGGVFSPGFIVLSDSFLSGNYSRDYGGGAYSTDMSVKYSTIENNRTYGAGGGLYLAGNATITNSTIDHNSAGFAGGIRMNALNATVPATLLNSTISNNVAFGNAGGFVGDYANVRVANSTIAFNYDTATTKYGAGLYVYGTVDFESTIVAGNTYAGGSAPDDIGGNATAVITGNNNLIGFSQVPPPAGTIELESPMLGQLAFNGGSTQTLMLLSGSPAIDTGNDTAGVAFDQRGSGYARTIGGGTDIGAYELDTNDLIFANGFDP